MIEFCERSDLSAGALVTDQLELGFEQRQKRQLDCTLRDGRAVRLRLPRGPMLRGGDLLRISDGTVIEVVAAPEKLLQVESNGANELARLAYHLGNRHVAVQIGDGLLRIAADSVLEKMLIGLGATVRRVVAPFEPEAGAYAHGHRQDEAATRPGRIHEYGQEPTTREK